MAKEDTVVNEGAEMSATTLDPNAAVPPELMRAALSLPLPTRAKLATALLESLDESADDPEVVREEWRAEIARRIEDLRSGKVKPVDGHAFLLRLRRELRERHGL